MKSVKGYDKGIMFTLSKSNLHAAVETLLRSLGRIPQDVDVVNIRFGAGDTLQCLNGITISQVPDLIPMEVYTRRSRNNRPAVKVEGMVLKRDNGRKKEA